MSTELADLNFRLSKAEIEAKEATENLAKFRDRETEQKEQVQKLQTERNEARSEQQKAVTSLTVSYVWAFIWAVIQSCQHLLKCTLFWIIFSSKVCKKICFFFCWELFIGKHVHYTISYSQCPCKIYQQKVFVYTKNMFNGLFSEVILWQFPEVIIIRDIISGYSLFCLP